jgi:predicted GIY-YIG superfamily endonuclease
MSEARKRECALKKLSRQQKIEIIWGSVNN